MRRTPTRNLTEPTRTCVGCRRLRARTELVRFVIDGGALKLGANRPGRGAWVCGESPIECFDAATEARGWSRSFRTRITTESTAEVRAELVAQYLSKSDDVCL